MTEGTGVNEDSTLAGSAVNFSGISQAPMIRGNVVMSDISPATFAALAAFAGKHKDCGKLTLTATGETVYGGRLSGCILVAECPVCKESTGVK